MGNWLNKLIRGLLNKRREFKQERNFQREAKRIRVIKKIKASDLERWKNTEELREDWNERIKIMAQMVPENTNVIEFGAGNMDMKNYLPISCRYQGSDIVKRSPEMLVCDLNKEIGFSLAVYDTAVFSGVMEYVYDIDNVFEQLNGKIKWVILSYACKDNFPENRERKGWLSDFTKEGLEKIFEKYGYQIKDLQLWRNQSIFKLVKE